MAEDDNGYRDEDGCPDAEDDHDGDGIPVRDDACPDQAFPYNRELAHDRRGCPPAFERVRVEGDRIVVRDPPLYFANNVFQLGEEHEKALDQVAELLTDYYPNMRLRLEGHADGEGSKAVNQRLSEARTRAVSDYLVRRGVELDRLAEKGFGENRPIRREQDEKDKRRNRRVELIILSIDEP